MFAPAPVSPDIPDNVARDSVTYVWPAYRDALTSLMDDSPLPAWLADPPLPTAVVMGQDDQTVLASGLDRLIGAGVHVVRRPRTHMLPVERPGDIADAVLAAGNTKASTTL